jgi:hypothetical protein
MADLAHPIVTVSYQCGCVFVDDVEIGGTRRFVFGADENRVFRAVLAIKRGASRTATIDNELALIRASERPARATLLALSDDELYVALLQRAANDVATTVTDGVRFPQPPPQCPRHRVPAEHSHASYIVLPDIAEDTP